MKYWIFTFLLLFVCKFLVAQDIIFKTNGDEVQAKVLEVAPDEIKYKMFNFQDGPTYILKKTDVFMIKYSNGHKDVFSNTNSNTNPVKKEDAVAHEYVNGGESQQQQTQQQEQYNFKVVNISNPNFKVMHNEIIKTNSSNKDQIAKLVSSLEDAILKDDMKRAWELLDEIRKQN